MTGPVEVRANLSTAPMPVTGRVIAVFGVDGSPADLTELPPDAVALIDSSASNAATQQ